MTAISFNRSLISDELATLRNRFHLAIHILVFAALLTATSICQAHGEELSAPTGPVLLRLEGNIEHTNDGERAAFDREMLESLPQISFTTSTVWTKGERAFSGPSLKSVMDAVGASGTSMTTFAVNDYKIDIPITSLTETAPIIATRIDGHEFGVRDNGPLWVVYPYDSSAEYQSELIYSRSIWQLVRIVVSD